MKPIPYPILGLLFLLLVAGCAQAPAPAPVMPEAPVVEPTVPIVDTPTVPESPLEEDPTPEPETEAPATPAPEPEVEYFTLPELTYEGTYDGSLVDTSAQITSAPMDQHFVNMNRNGVHAFVGYFSVVGAMEEGKLSNQEGLGFMLDAVQKHPGRIIPFFSLGWGADETTLLPAKEILQYYKNSYSPIPSIAGEGIVKGFGEIEQYGWSGSPANGTKMKGLVELAESQGLHFMFHPPKGEVNEVRELVEKYPDTRFIIHQFNEDFGADREKWIELLKDHPHVYFSVDVDHLLYDASKKVGLLYEFQNSPLEKGAERFVEEYDEKEAKLLSNAIAKYKPFIVAVPNQVMWGTEMGPEYNYDPDVYDRIIKFSRTFIAFLPEEIQEKFAYQNAWNAFGPGSTLQKEIVIADASGWATCTNAQENQCAIACGEDEDDITPTSEACLLVCEYDLQCNPPDVDN